MGRHKTNRDIALYTRINKENDRFLKRICKTSGLSKTAFIDKQLDYLRNNISNFKYLEKTRNKIQRESRQAT